MIQDEKFKNTPYFEQYKLTHDYITYTILLSNYIGIVFCKTLHYQFYAWYFHSIPYLLYQTNIPVFLRILMIVCLEYSYLVFPATSTSSLVLQTVHVGLL